MEQTQYGIIKPAKPEFEPRELLVVPHRGAPLVVSRFGPDNYNGNVQEMQGNFSCLPDYEKISFREPTISESVSVCAYDFENLAKPQILDLRWLQLGRIAKTSEGVFANPPKDEDGNPIVDEKILKSFLNGIEPVNGIYLCENDFGFASCETFQTGIQDSETFSRGGLARLLEHTEKPVAENIGKISSLKNYKAGVNVWGFDKVKEPLLRVASLCSNRDVEGLLVDGGLSGGYDCGYAFGVL